MLGRSKKKMNLDREKLLLSMVSRGRVRETKLFSRSKEVDGAFRMRRLGESDNDHM